MKRRLSFWAALFLATAWIAGCGQPTAAEVARSSTPTSAPTLAPPEVSAVPPVAPTQSPGTAPVTLADNGRTVTLHAGQRFLLNLGAEYNWQFEIADQSIVSRVVNVLTIRGSQGLFEAHKPGQTSLTATGDPPCRQSQPPCGAPSIQFGVEIVVRP